MPDEFERLHGRDAEGAEREDTLCALLRAHRIELPTGAEAAAPQPAEGSPRVLETPRT